MLIYLCSCIQIFYPVFFPWHILDLGVYLPLGDSLKISLYANSIIVYVQCIYQMTCGHRQLCNHAKNFREPPAFCSLLLPLLLLLGPLQVFFFHSTERMVQKGSSVEKKTREVLAGMLATLLNVPSDWSFVIERPILGDNPKAHFALFVKSTWKATKTADSTPKYSVGCTRPQLLLTQGATMAFLLQNWPYIDTNYFLFTSMTGP